MHTPRMLLKVGELARRTGLTVRALHHYNSIGLVHTSCALPQRLTNGAVFAVHDQPEIGVHDR